MRKIKVISKGKAYSLLKEITRYGERYIVAYLFNEKTNTWIAGSYYNDYDTAKKIYIENAVKDAEFWREEVNK